MKTFWHFGDSFTCPGNLKGWGYKLSKKLDYKNFNHRGVSGVSNYQILSNILREVGKFKKGDYILINWSFLSRGTIMKEVGELSTNRFYSDEDKNFNYRNLNNNEIDLLNEYGNFIKESVDNSLQQNSMVFKLSSLLQKYLYESHSIKTSNVFLEKDWLTLNGKKVKWPDNNFKLNEVKFEGGYFKWLDDNDYLGDSQVDTHYKENISDIIADEYCKRIVNII